MKHLIPYLLITLLMIAFYGGVVTHLDNQAEGQLEKIFNDQQGLQIDQSARSIQGQYDYTVEKAREIAGVDIPLVLNQKPANSDMLYQSLEVVFLREEQLLHAARGFWITPDTPVIIHLHEHDYEDIVTAMLEQGIQTHWSEIKEKGEEIFLPFEVASDYQFYGLLTPVYYPDGQFIGILGTVINFHEVLEQYIIPLRSGKYGAAWIQGHDGLVIYDHETQIIGQNVADLHLGFPEIQALDSRFLRETSGTTEYEFTVQRGEEVQRKIMAWDTAWLGDYGLTVAISAPDTEISQMLNESRQDSLRLGILLLILLVASGIVTAYLQQRGLRQQVFIKTRALDDDRERLHREIEERQRIEEELRETGVFLTTILDNIPAMIFVKDKNLRYIRLNKAVLDKAKLTHVDVIGKTDAEYYPPEIAEFFARTDHQVIQERRQVDIPEEHLPFPTHAGRVQHTRKVPIFDSTGNLQYIMGISEDITDRKAAEERQMELLLQQNRIKLLETFISDMSHDIKTPISNLKTRLYILRRALDDAEKRDKQLAVMEEEVNRLEYLIDSLLTMTRLDSDMMELSLSTVNLNNLLRDMVESNEMLAQQKNHQVTANLGEESVMVIGNSIELTRAFTNIFTNALHYTPDGGKIDLQLQLQPGSNPLSNADSGTDSSKSLKKKQAIVTIRDTGIGVDRDDLERIFERFYRADKSRHRQGSSNSGAGLGLSIARRIIEAHSGTIAVESSPGQGTTFTISLPAR